jgi:phosphomannomutase/phosphoglucomutase
VINLEGKNTLFGTSGIRGKESLFTKQFCFDIAASFVDFLKPLQNTTSIAIGMDPRSSSPKIKKYLIESFSSFNIQVHDQGVTPIPSINWMIKNTPTKAAIMITGSHIAPDRNGLKFYAHDEEVTVDDQKQIEKNYVKISKEKFPPPTSQKPNTIIENKAQRLYTQLLLSLSQENYPSWKVAIDCADGAQSQTIPPLLEKLGLNVIKVNCNLQDNFIARDTDTSDKAQIEDLKKQIIKDKCDFGIAFDGDGDRVVFLDEKANFILGEYSCGLVAKHSDSDTIVTPISSSSVVDHLGKNIVRTKVGSPYVIQKMKETNSTFGFEPNGGAISAEIMYTRDGGTTMIKLLNILASSKQKFSQLVNSLPVFYMHRSKIDYKWEQQESILKKAKETFKGEKTEEIDGLKIWLSKDTWILFRSSQNAPEFRVFAESTTDDKAKELMQKGISFVKKQVKS